MEKRYFCLHLRPTTIVVSLWNSFGVGFEKCESACWLDLGFLMIAWLRRDEEK